MSFVKSHQNLIQVFENAQELYRMAKAVVPCLRTDVENRIIEAFEGLC